MTRAIQLAGLQPSDIDHVNAHATGTSVGDVAEGKAINNAMAGHKPAVYAPKAALGHLSVRSVRWSPSLPCWHCATASSLRRATCRTSIRRSIWTLSPVSRGRVISSTQSTIRSGFGGHNVALAFGKY